MRVESRVMIRRPILEVFEFVSEPKYLPLWASGGVAAERTYQGPMGLGVTFELHYEGGAYKECWEVIEHEPPRAIAYRRLDWGAFSQVRYTLRNVDGWTALGLEVHSGVGTSPESCHLLEHSAQRQLEADLGLLREILENGFCEEGMEGGDAADRVRVSDVAVSGVPPMDGHGDRARPVAAQGATTMPGTGTDAGGSGGSRPGESG